MAATSPPVIALADIEPRLALFAEGMNGGYLHIKAGEDLPLGAGQAAAARAAQSRDSLHLPSTLDADDPGLYLVLALQQIVVREFGGLGFRLATAYQRLPGLGRIPAPPLTGRPTDRWRFYHHFPNPQLAAELLEGFERIRLDAAMVRAYPGILPLLQAYHAFLQRTPETHPASPVAFSLFQFASGGGASRPQDRILHPIASRLLPPGADIYDSAQAVRDALGQLNGADGEALEAVPELAATAIEGAERQVRLEDWERQAHRLDNALLAAEMLESEQLEANRSEGGGGEVRDEQFNIKRIRHERDQLSRRIGLERSALRDAQGEDHGAARSYRYDEWDFHAQAYRRNHCRLFETGLQPKGDEDIAALKRTLQARRHSVQQQLEQLKPLGRQRRWGLADGDEVDLNAAIAARQDLKAGHSPDERFYSRRERIHRDICAVLLVDLSASTDDPVEKPDTPPTTGGSTDPEARLARSDKMSRRPARTAADSVPTPNLRGPYEDDAYFRAQADATPAPPQRRIIDLLREAAAVVAAAMERLGDSYGIYGFSGYGRECVEFYVAKDLRQPLNAAALARIAAMQPKRSTRMGPAIRHAAHRLANSGNALKVLLLLSDGFPQDCDYGPERGNRGYGLHDTAKALAEAHQKGVETFCVTVDRSGHDYLRQMCPDTRYAVIEELEDLPAALTKVYIGLTS